MNTLMNTTTPSTTEKKLLQNNIVVICISLALLAMVIFLYKGYTGKAVGPARETQVPYIVPALTKEYSNTEYRFSLKTPQDFTAREMNVDGVTTIVFENSITEGIQISISKFDEKSLVLENGVKVFDVPFIQKNIQDMKILDAQPIEVGSGYRGVAFKSDNEAFDSASREVWFVFQSNLYQISTYERFDELLKDMFASWKFN